MHAGQLDINRASPIAIVLEDTHSLSQVAQDMGFQVIRHCHRAVGTGITNVVAGQIKDGSLNCFISAFPIGGFASGRKQDLVTSLKF